MLHQKYFQFDHDFYIQEENHPLGSLLFGLIADIILLTKPCNLLQIRLLDYMPNIKEIKDKLTFFKSFHKN